MVSTIGLDRGLDKCIAQSSDREGALAVFAEVGKDTYRAPECFIPLGQSVATARDAKSDASTQHPRWPIFAGSTAWFNGGHLGRNRVQEFGELLMCTACF